MKGNDLYKGGAEKLARCRAEDIRKTNGLNAKRVAVIAKALEILGYIEDAEAWLGG